ncbi:MAG TPA: DUF4199 domain-containing protein [Gammaproteobacteria bacterium]|nr:DUF4199 domain-containing protein [Gammaproteobacteria bacterium]
MSTVTAASTTRSTARIVLVYGLLAGLIVAVPMVALMVTLTAETAPQYGAVYGYLTMIIALTAVFLGVKRYRDRVLGGAVRFVPALLVGLAISAVASVIYAIGWEVSLALSGFDLPAAYTKEMVAAARAQGASAAEIERAAEQGAAFARLYANPLYRFPITFVEIFPIGVVIAAISAALFRNSRFLPARDVHSAR